MRHHPPRSHAVDRLARYIRHAFDGLLSEPKASGQYHSLGDSCGCAGQVGVMRLEEEASASHVSTRSGATQSAFTHLLSAPGKNAPPPPRTAAFPTVSFGKIRSGNS